MRRLFWLGAGFGLGVAAARRARRRQQASTPDAPSPLGRALRAHVDDAIAEGRAEARRREATLRSLLAASKSKPEEPGK